jgi:AraC-like DNA-binding protein
MIKEYKLKKRTIAERAVEEILSTSNEGIKNLDSKEIAAVLKVNKILLSRLFRKDQKMSITGFIQREKIHRAFFIIEKDFSISIPELSERLGFGSPGQFEKAFFDYFCVLPGKYQALKKELKISTSENAPPEKFLKDLESLRN